MEPEPNRDMDELLKAYAKQRKAQVGDPFELHSATRNLLQTEVSRLAKRKPTPPSAPKLGFWGDVWLRLVFGGAICGVLVLIAGVSIWTLSKSSVNYQIAKDSSRPTAEFATFTAPARSAPEPAVDSLVPPGTPPERGERASGRYGSVDSNLKLEERKSPTPSGASGGLRADLGQQLARGGANELLLRQRSEAELKYTRENDLAKRDRGADAIAAPALTPAADENAVNTRGGIALAAAIAQPVKETQEALLRNQQQIGQVSYQNSAGQRFVQTTARPKSKVSAKPSAADFVLNSFVVEQDGAQLRFIDADGSIYEGALLDGDAAAVRTPASIAYGEKLLDETKKTAVSRRLNSPKAAAIQTAENSPRIKAEIANYKNSSFRVAGTNLSVNQNVIVNGNFIVNTNAMAAIAAGQLRSSGVQNFQNNSILPRTPNSRIYGNAIVGGRTQVEINATAAAR